MMLLFCTSAPPMIPEYRLYDLQPAACRQPAMPAKVQVRGRLAPVIRRVIAYDPGPAYSRISGTADPLKRIQVRSNLSLLQLFPKKRDGYCDCGCGQPITGRKARWAGPECSSFVWYVYAIIAGRRHEIRQCLTACYGKACAGCGAVPARYRAGKGRLRNGLEADHVIPVHRGGGACWLSNYRQLCIGCHRQKTDNDRRARKLTTAKVLTAAAGDPCAAGS